MNIKSLFENVMKFAPLFVIITFSSLETTANGNRPNNGFQKFKTKYQWTHINFTWPSEEAYKSALEKQQYSPRNIIPIRLQFHGDRVYISTPRFRDGVPSTLNYIDAKDNEQDGIINNPVLTPFPSWDLQDLDGDNKCSSLVSVMSMHIDHENGVLWVVDGERVGKMSGSTECPCKIVLIDLSNGEILQQHVMEDKVCAKDGSFLTSLVVEDNEYAYITDASDKKPGIVVYVKSQDKSYKVSDGTMRVNQPERLKLGDYTIHEHANVNGIVLLPRKSDSDTRLVYYTTLGDRVLFNVSTDYLKNEDYADNCCIKANVVGKFRHNGVDAMVIDDSDNLYYTAMPLNAVGRFDTKKSMKGAKIYDKSDDTSLWLVDLALDERGCLSVLSFIYEPNYMVALNGSINFFISEANIKEA